MKETPKCILYNFTTLLLITWLNFSVLESLDLRTLSIVRNSKYVEHITFLNLDLLPSSGEGSEQTD
jgi:hypothetical protein